jgi:hypothetical protein
VFVRQEQRRDKSHPRGKSLEKRWQGLTGGGCLPTISHSMNETDQPWVPLSLPLASEQFRASGRAIPGMHVPIACQVESNLVVASLHRGNHARASRRRDVVTPPRRKLPWDRDNERPLMSSQLVRCWQYWRVAVAQRQPLALTDAHGGSIANWKDWHDWWQRWSVWLTWANGRSSFLRYLKGPFRCASPVRYLGTIPRCRPSLRPVFLSGATVAQRFVQGISGGGSLQRKLAMASDNECRPPATSNTS